MKIRIKFLCFVEFNELRVAPFKSFPSKVLLCHSPLQFALGVCEIKFATPQSFKLSKV